MTSPNDRGHDSPERDAFATELRRLIAAAHENGVDLVGVYDVPSPEPAEDDYTVEVTKVRKSRGLRWNSAGCSIPAPPESPFRDG